MDATRREFNAKLLGSLMTFGLVETLWSRDLFADPVKPTIDRSFGPGDLSTISDHRDNVHWFKAGTDGAYIFNVHVIGYDPQIKDSSGRLYLDPDGEKLAGESRERLLVRLRELTANAAGGSGPSSGRPGSTGAAH